MPPKPQTEPEVRTDPTPESEPADKSATIEDVRRIVTEAVSGILDRLGEDPAEEVPETKPEAPKRGRRTFRDMEEEMEDLVTQKVKDLLKREKAQGEAHPEPGTEKAPPEPIPASPPQRRVERALWGSNAGGSN